MKWLAMLKVCVFRLTITPMGDLQSVRILNKWRFVLKDELGLVSEYELHELAEEHIQDKFGRFLGNVVHAFYSKFTPTYIILVLIQKINVDAGRLKQVVEFIRDTLKEVQHASIDEMFEFGSDEARSKLTPTSINEKGVEHILLKMQILKKK